MKTILGTGLYICSYNYNSTAAVVWLHGIKISIIMKVTQFVIGCICFS